MRTQRKTWIRGTALGIVAAVLVSAIPTFLDWKINPGGIFQSSTATNWSVVTETFVSWLWPVALITVPVVVLADYLISKHSSGAGVRQVTGSGGE